MRSIKEVVKQYDHICWYPSAGDDFRALLFLSDWYYKRHNVPLDQNQTLPDLFILTDLRGINDIFRYEDLEKLYGMGHISLRRCEPGTCILRASYMGRYTEIFLYSIERLENCDFSFDSEITSFSRSQEYNSAFKLEVEVETKKYGTVNRFIANVIYVSVQNEYFIKEFLAPNIIEVEYQVLVRYGNDSRNPKNMPVQIIRDYRKNSTKYLISNTKYVMETLADSKDEKNNPQFEKIYSINGSQWSKYGEVGWYKLT